jgi:hypothetical protein
MGWLIHWSLALVLLGTATCTTVHAEMPKNSPGMANCPFHQNGKQGSRSAPASQQSSQHCQDCLTTHFISESKINHEVPSAAQITLPTIVEVDTTVSVSPLFFQIDYEFANFTAYHVIRV